VLALTEALKTTNYWNQQAESLVLKEKVATILTRALELMDARQKADAFKEE
jgi:hypothetical protein